MLNITARDSSDAVKAYYTGTTRGDYYTEHSEIIGHWGGKGAARLKLLGTVDKDSFNKLADNVHPLTGASLTPRMKANRTIGYDFTFDVPKSVSVLYGLTNDRKIMEAFRNAVHETMIDIETAMETRVRLNGQKDGTRPTGNLIWAEFIHLTARPVDGIPDPQLHSHIFVPNATFDAVEDRWKAGMFRQIVLDAPLYQAVFHSRLTEELKALGYSIVGKEKGFEIEGMPDSILAQFSRRTAVIEKEAKRRGITDAAEKAKLAALTREAKNKLLSPLELTAEWSNRLTPGELKLVMDIWQEANGRAKEHAKAHAISPAREYLGTRSEPLPSVMVEGLTVGERAAVKQALLHCFWNQSAVTESRLKEAILRFGIGEVRVKDLNRVVANIPGLIRKDHERRKMVTVEHVLEEECRMIDWVKAGRNALPALAPGYVVQDQRLGPDQRAALHHILESLDRVTGMEGRAGTGKTTLMKECLAALEAKGHRVVALAPTASAARDLEKYAGFPEALTVDGWLASPSKQRQVGFGAVWWVDEAGLLSTRAMVRLADLAHKLDARLILGGDTRQHRAVERGDALRILKEHASVPLAQVNTIRRQTGTYREVVEALAEGDLHAGFAKLDAMKAIVEMPEDKRYKAVAKEYVESLNRGESVLVVSPTHLEIHRVTTAIREALKAEGRLKRERKCEILRQVRLSPAEKMDLRSYRTGMVLEMTQSAPGALMPSNRLKVEGVEEKTLLLSRADGRLLSFDPCGMSERFEVYRPDLIDLAQGDRIQITKNRKNVPVGQKVFNGKLYTVTGFTAEGDIKLEGGIILPKDFMHLTHGYATTSFVAQGKTVAKVLVVESNVSFSAGSREQFYVSISRGAKEILVFTSDRDELLEAVQHSSQRTAAMDLVQSPANAPEGVYALPLETLDSASQFASPAPAPRAKPRHSKRTQPEPPQIQQEEPQPHTPEEVTRAITQEVMKAKSREAEKVPEVKMVREPEMDMEP